MATLAAVMTGQSTSAIATIQMVGQEAMTIVERLFKPAGSKPRRLEPGAILIGTLMDQEQSIDQIALACETPQVLNLHCHGNPLLTETIMALLRRHGATLVGPRHLHAALLHTDRSLSTLAVEARLVLQTVKTLTGATLLEGQLHYGLTQWTQRWLVCSTIPMSQFTAECHHILERGHPARYTLYGCTLVLAGPPNVGKSTLLNSLTGRDNAIVTDVKGTTRDWIKATLSLDRLFLNVIDTAGLETSLPNEGADHPDKASQERTRQILDSADLILLILDQNQPADQFESPWCSLLQHRRILIVLNKADLPCRLTTTELPFPVEETISISAKNDQGLASLITHIETELGIDTLDPKEPICFTDRQTQLMNTLSVCTAEPQIKHLLNDLLSGNPNDVK